jgi:hypothetical protein
MLSIGELIEKVVIENIKIFNLRQVLHDKKLTKQEYVDINDKMMTLNDNKSVITKELDRKLDAVIGKKEKNRILKTIKTY